MQERGEKLIRFIIYSVIAYFVIRFVKRLFKASTANVGSTAKPKSSAQSKDDSLMIRCAACGTFITQGSAIAIGSARFCSSACARIQPQKV
ncbi:MAG: PP0621 family protein [Acidobacteriota bacterium]